MAEFIINCIHCNAELQVQEEWINLEAECPECGKSIIIERIVNPESNSEKTEINKHLQYAYMAINNKALQEAEKEFKLVLDIENDNIQALYGCMLCDAYMSTPEKSLLGNIIYQYKKIEMIISQKQHNFSDFWSIEQVREHFISDIGSFVVNSYNNTVSTLMQLREAAKTREAINVLNAYASKIALSNPEAMEANAAGKILFPYLAQIMSVRKFIISLLDIETASQKDDTLILAKQIFESTLDISKEEPEIIIAYNTICKTYAIKNIINELQCSENDAELEYERRRSLSLPQENKFISKFSSLTWLIMTMGTILLNVIWISSCIMLAKADKFLPLPVFMVPMFIFGFGGLFLFLIFISALRLEKRNGKIRREWSLIIRGWSLFKKYWKLAFLAIFWIIFFILGIKGGENIFLSACWAFLLSIPVYGVIWFFELGIAFLKMKF